MSNIIDTQAKKLGLIPAEKIKRRSQMSENEKLQRYGKVFGVYKSETSSREYEVRQTSANTFSCNCPGWTKHVDEHGNRTCKHVRDAEAKQLAIRESAKTETVTKETIKKSVEKGDKKQIAVYDLEAILEML